MFHTRTGFFGLAALILPYLAAGCGDDGTASDATTSPDSEETQAEVSSDTGSADSADLVDATPEADSTTDTYTTDDDATDTADDTTDDDTRADDTTDDATTGDDTSDTSAAAWPFASDQVWAADGEALPPEAVMVSPEEFLALSQIDGFHLQTKAARDAAAAAHAADVAADEALVMAAYADHPHLAQWLPPLDDPGPDDMVKLPDGSYQFALATTTGDPVVIQSNSRENVVQAIAASLGNTTARDNLERRFASLVGLLPDDARADLATVDTLGDLDDAALAAEVARVEARLDDTTPRQILPEAFRADPVSSTGCNDGLEHTLADDLAWRFKDVETPVRSQGKRGTCSAFAVVAAMETAVFLAHGIPIDLSEQELYSEARDNWLIDPADFHDGIGLWTLLDNMIGNDFRVDAEHRWPYNPSRKREQDGVLLTYKYSCLDYDHICSNTNHQRGTACTQAPPPYHGTYCATHQPEPATLGGNIGNARVKDVVSLWNGLEPENSLRAIRTHINAGHPVAIGVWLDPNFKLEADVEPEDQGEDTGWIEQKSWWATDPAPHSMLVVGYIWDSELPTAETPYVPDWRDLYAGHGGGYFVLKNSWGCRGDKGHFFVSFDWLADTIYEAYAITDVGTPIVAPGVTLTGSRTSLTSAGSVRFTATLNRAVVRYELFEGLDGYDAAEEVTPTPIFTKDLAQPADGTTVTFDRAFTAADNGLRLFVAAGYDTFGNRVTSNIVGVLVKVDTAAPVIALSALETSIAAPGTVRLRAVASDDIGVTRVRFYRGLTYIGDDTTAPFALDFGVGPSQYGTTLYVAMAEDAVGHLQLSNTISVSVVAPTTKPIVGTFSATPQDLPYPGGSVKLQWAVLGATDVTIAPGVGTVGTMGARWVSVTDDTTFTLTATNAQGTTTRSATVLVAAQQPPLVTSFTATPPSVPTGGGRALLQWEVGGAPTSLVITPDVGSVLGRSSQEVEVLATTTFTLSATNAAGTTTRTTTVTVLPDTTPPTVSLAASAASVVAPATLHLSATVADDIGVTDVVLIMDDTPIDSAPPLDDKVTFDVALTAEDAGLHTFVATAYDAAGNHQDSDRVEVLVELVPAPDITTFDATPATLPPGGGETTLTWTIAGPFDAVTLLPAIDGVTDVTGLADKTVRVTGTTTFTLIAANAGSTAQRTLEVTVLPDTKPPEVALAASHDVVTAPAVVRFAATATDDLGVTRVELAMDGALVDALTSPEDGVYLFDVLLTPADIGLRAFTATAYDAAGNAATSAAVTVDVQGVPPPPAPEITSFTATPSALPPVGGTTTLAWAVTGTVDTLTIDHGVGDVHALTQRDVAVQATTTFTITATNEGGQATRQVLVTVAPDTTPPAVALAASATDVVAPALVTLTATASDDVGVDLVELWLDGRLLDTDDDGSDGWSFLVALALADVGVHTLEAAAWDAAQNHTTSNTITLVVSAPDLRAFVSPTGVDTGNADCRAATPCRTIAKAATVAAGAHTVVLRDGTYDTTTQGSAAIVLPAGTMIEAEHGGQAIVKVVLSFTGGSIRGVVVDRTAPNAATGVQIRVTGGTMHIVSVAFRGSFSGANVSEGIEATGDAVVTVEPGDVADYTAETVALSTVSWQTPFIRVEDTASLTVLGGTFGGPGLGAQPSTPSNGAGAALLVRDQGTLRLVGVTLSYRVFAASVLDDAELRLEGTTFVANTTAAVGGGIILQGAAGEVPKLFMTDATLDGAGLSTNPGIRVYDATTTAEVTLDGAVIDDHGQGVHAFGTLALTALDSDIVHNAYGGIRCERACTLELTGGSIASNARGGVQAPYGGLWLGSTTQVYHLTMRGVAVTGNRSQTVDASTNRNDNSGIVLEGAAGSVFDLGTGASPGGNVFTGNVTGVNTSSLWVSVAAGVTVSAVGNTWQPGIQGADAAGHYDASSIVCGAAPCDVGSGAGDNFRVSSGQLRLAE